MTWNGVKEKILRIIESEIRIVPQRSASAMFFVS